MTLYTSPFGNGVLVGSGGNVTSNVHNQFGPRSIGGAVGPLKVEGSIEQVRIDIDGNQLNDLVGPLVDTYLPVGSTIRDVYWDTVTAFTLGGTTPTILVGTSGSEVTNGLVVSNAVASSTNTARLTGTLTGTWAVNTPLQARTKVGIVLGGTTPTSARTGRGILTIEIWRPNVGKNF